MNVVYPDYLWLNHPIMPKSQKKALRFAYDLLCGRYRGKVPFYVHATVPRDLRGQAEESPAPWIEPDFDARRPYLNEAVFTALVMKGYFECQVFEPGTVWLYRLSRDGCAKLGWKWPTHARYPLTERDERNAQLSQMIRRGNPLDSSQQPKRRISYDPHRFRRSNDWRKQ
ncbi:MAG: hypothetical protein H7Y09_13320 [Chitinophagaceae bacterium]|nr:hypothetical protein [Anaerolineae bacterium]